MNFTAATYVAYLLTAIPITIWVASTLSRNGRVFLTDVFHGEDGLADLTGLLETLSVKIGVVLLVLGVIHFVNVMAFSSMRRRGRAEADRARQAAAYAYQAYPQQPPR